MYINSTLSVDKVEKTASFAKIALIIIFIILFFSFWNIQILRHAHYNKLAMGNITDNIEINAPRGVIVDKNGVVLAENKINFILLLNRKNTNDIEKTLRKISQITGKSLSSLKKKLRKFRSIPKIRSIPLIKDLSINEVVYIKSRPTDFKEFDITVEPDREYPLNKSAAHIIGYISEISEKEMKAVPDKGYKLGDSIGKNGIEKTYENFLRGNKGKRDVLKNNLGVVKEIISEKKPKIGNKVFLTIDIELQKSIETLLVKKKLKGTIGIFVKTGMNFFIIPFSFSILSKRCNCGFFPLKATVLIINRACAGVTSIMPPPIEMDMVSPTDQSRLFLNLKESVGINPLISFGISISVFFPRPSKLAYFAMTLIFIFFPRL